MSSSTSLRSSPLAHLSALLTSSVGGGGGSSCTGSATGGSSPSAFLTSLTNCVDGALGLVDDDDAAATKNNKDEDEFVATKAAANVANDDCNSNNDQHKGTRLIATPCLIFCVSMTLFIEVHADACLPCA